MSTTDLTTTDEKRTARPPIAADDVNPISMMFDPIIADRVMAIAKTLASGTVTVPEHLRGNVGDCLAIVMQSASWKLNPFAVAQKTFLIQGKLGYEAQLVNAVATSLRVIEGPFRYEYFGNWPAVTVKPIKKTSQRGMEYFAPGWNEKDEDGIGVRVTATLRETGTDLTHELYLMQCWPRNSTLWATNPQQQIAYLAVKQWMRKYAPAAILGVYTQDEIEAERIIQGTTIEDDMASLRPARQAVAAIVADKRAAADATSKPSKPSEPEPEPEKLSWPEERDGVLYDSLGTPYNARFHSATKAITTRGVWRLIRGCDTDAYEAWLDQLSDNSSEPPNPEPQPQTKRDPGEVSVWSEHARRHYVEVIHAQQVPAELRNLDEDIWVDDNLEVTEKEQLSELIATRTRQINEA